MPKTYNTFTNVSTGDVLTATNFNNVLENVGNYRVPPLLRLKKTASQSISGNTNISWDAEDYDTDAMWTSGATITAKTAGVYLWHLSARVTAAAAPTVMYVNGPDNARMTVVLGADMRMTFSGVWVAAANATTVLAFEPTGGTTLSLDGTTVPAIASFVWLGQVS